MQGWLRKKSPNMGQQQRRWFKLADTMLYYYKDEKDGQPKGAIPLR